MWSANYFIQIYNSVTLWKQKINSANNINCFRKNHSIYVSGWQKYKKWQQDHVWIQKYTAKKQNKSKTVYS